jgi:uncharacterized glyoxalase superfamily protein PhnB
MQNRSVPANVVLPHIVYEDVAGAIAWMVEVFGFREHFRYGPPDAPQGAQIHLGEAWVMLSSAREGRGSPVRLGGWTQSLTVFVEDVEAHCARTKAQGAKVVEDLHETEYGKLQYAAEDLERHLWIFSRHARDVAPEEWGAVVSGEWP